MRNTILLELLLILISSCNKNEEVPSNIDYRQEMRDFVVEISQYAKSYQADFFIIPQNGIELILNNDEEQLNYAYLESIDGNGQEDLFYGYVNDNQPTPSDENAYLTELLDLSANAGKVILVTDYCSTHGYMDDSYLQNNTRDYVVFAADHRELNNIPSYPSPIYAENNNDISFLNGLKNFLYLINPETYATKTDFINAISNTNYDLIIMDLFFNDGTAFSSSEIDLLKTKLNGAKRLVICYLSIGEAEDYRYYWQTEWNSDPPIWLDSENPDWAGNYKVKYWETDWQSIIFGNENSYITKIIESGFDGVYLDIIDAFEYYE